MFKMIITDLDETLLRSDKTISDYTVDILKKCQFKGIKIVFATARSTQAASRFLALFNPDIFIGYGGALISAGNMIIHRIDIPADVSSRLIKDCINTPEITYLYAINESVAFTNDTEFMSQKDSAHYQYADFSDNYDFGYLKISVVSDGPEAVEKIAAHYPMCDMLRYSGENLYRFANRNAIKWNAVNAISENYNIGTNEFIAFGDDYNDLEMIQKCGTGVAVKNAVDDVKSVAKYICESNNDDGVAKWIEENIL
jgi:Cof subfamily protein (haloacid dehalogenase superfamily)